MLSAMVLSAQPRVLHFTRTSGYDHGTREVSFAMFQSIAAELNVVVDDDATGASFSSGLLDQYDVIIFSNTTGDAILDGGQRLAFEQWIANGRHVMGIHSATDTYRHSSGNGSNTGTWDYYAELIGASVQENPSHVSGTPPYAMTLVGLHASTANLPDPWVKNEEYYYWEGGYFGTDNTEVLRVEETMGPNGQVNSYDAPRPMSWYRELPNGSRVFYTALGHATANYTGDALFRTHIKDALEWLLDGNVSIPAENGHRGWVSLNHGTNMIRVIVPPPSIGSTVSLLDAMGRLVRSVRSERTEVEIDVCGLPSGAYLLRAGTWTAPVPIVR